MRYFIVTIVLIFFIITGSIFFVLRGRSNNNKATTNKPPALLITDYSNTNSEVRMTLDGKIVGSEEHRAIRVTISSEKRKLEIIEGYEDKIINSQLFSNDASAYEEFLYALKTANYLKLKSNANPDASEKGVCPTGRRYIYELYTSGTLVKRVWSTSCSDSQGNNAGNNSLIQQLFRQQIPDYNSLTNNVSLG